jgi:hypothetical protein
MEYVVIGAGPVGPQVGYFLQRAGREYLVLGGGLRDPGRNLRYDWGSLLSNDGEKPKFTTYTGKYLDGDILDSSRLCREPLRRFLKEAL